MPPLTLIEWAGIILLICAPYILAEIRLAPLIDDTDEIERQIAEGGSAPKHDSLPHNGGQ